MVEGEAQWRERTQLGLGSRRLPSRRLHGFAESQAKYVTLSGPLFPGLLSSYKLQSWRQWDCRRPGQPQPWVGGKRVQAPEE